MIYRLKRSGAFKVAKSRYAAMRHYITAYLLAPRPDQQAIAADLQSPDSRCYRGVAACYSATSVPPNCRVDMDAWAKHGNKCDGREYVRPGEKDIYVQLTISLALGLSAFIVFCVSALLSMSSRLGRARASQMHHSSAPCSSAFVA